MGASAVSVAGGFNGDLTLGVYPQFGMGENLSGILQYTTLEEITRWLQLDISSAAVREYLFQKSIYPSAIPATREEQAIAQAIARQALYLSVRLARRSFPLSVQRTARANQMPALDLVIGGGGAISDGPSLGPSLLLMLDDPAGGSPAGPARPE